MTEIKKETTPEPVAVKEAAPVKEVVVEVAKKEKEVPALNYTENGAIGSGTNKIEKPKTETKVNPKPVVEKVALFAENNVYSEDFGKISIGYNIVNKKASEFWLKRRDIRLATPEEVAGAFTE
jgi:hypothetical protein